MPRGTTTGKRFLWTTQAIQQLRKLAARGLTSQQISDIMGPSRGAIIGKQQREGIVLLGRAGHFGVSPGSAWRDPAAVLPIEERSGAAAAMVALHQSHCRWPIGAPEGPDFHYCSAARANLERPYCAKHEAVAASGVAMANYMRKNRLRSPLESVL
jgi:GcrA cell cycle regulator